MANERQPAWTAARFPVVRSPNRPDWTRPALASAADPGLEPLGLDRRPGLGVIRTRAAEVLRAVTDTFEHL